MHTIRTPAYQSGDHTQLLQTGTSVYKNTPNGEVMPEATTTDIVKVDTAPPIPPSERILASKGRARC